MRVLVTGGAGLIGMALRHLLAEAHHAVTACDATDYGRGDKALLIAPFADTAALERIVRSRSIEAIIHCGAISGPMLAKSDPLTIVDTNIAATARLLDIARRHDLRRFVFCSSIGVYGNVGEGIISETTPLAPTSVYGASKVAGEALVRGFVAEYGLSAVSLRPSRVYGPYRRANCFIRDIVLDVKDGRTTVIPCDPEFLFHYVYVNDVASALIAALEADYLPHLAYNVDAGAPMTMPEVVTVAGAVLHEASIELVPGSDIVSDAQAGFDISLIAVDLGWRPRFALAEGIRDYASKLPDTTMPGT
ncbi:MAG TPA: NAD(P)-dependent oxidoreductase [Roseiarcus sp.]|nr:NAD(P)-dependent oxidoreductase [Roseiarcus sp.]